MAIEKKNHFKIVLAPGNGAGDVTNCLWYPDLVYEMKRIGIPVILRNFPDPLYAKETIWVPFMRDELHCDENTIVVGHSSGSAATMRLLESGTKVAGAVLVSAYYTDLGDDLERDSGYFSRAWDWGQIKQNAGFIAQFHSPQDYLVDVAEARFVHEKLNSEYFEIEDAGHFQVHEFPELYKLLKKKIALLEKKFSA